eukprot:1251440-Rhodomonas_salina.1
MPTVLLACMEEHGSLAGMYDTAAADCWLVAGRTAAQLAHARYSRCKGRVKYIKTLKWHTRERSMERARHIKGLNLGRGRDASPQRTVRGQRLVQTYPQSVQIAWYKRIRNQYKERGTRGSAISAKTRYKR